jgi:hypothetical protein
MLRPVSDFELLRIEIQVSGGVGTWEQVRSSSNGRIRVLSRRKPVDEIYEEASAFSKANGGVKIVPVSADAATYVRDCH